MKHIMLGAAISFALAPAAALADVSGRGEDGQFYIIYWQAPSTLNPYLSGGAKEVEAAWLVLEPLAGFDDT